MITELKLSNFRLFGKEVTVRFRPITILIGKNNSGKSSIIKFLMMLKQSTMRVRGFLTMDGNEVRLGRFYELKNKNEDMENLRFSLSVGDNVSPSDDILAFIKNQFKDKGKTNEAQERIYKVSVTIPYNSKGGRQEITLQAGNEVVLKEGLDISPDSSFLPLTGGESKRQAIIPECIEKLRYDIQGLDHLSAARRELEESVPKESFSSNVGKIGEHTLSQLWGEKILDNPEKKEFLIKHAKNVLGIDEIDIDESDDQSVECLARNKLAKAKVNISAFGFGVSQCLPIFVQGLLMPPRSQLIVEEPEAQVHPTAQIEMGSFFVDLWKEYGVGSIIETHSENTLIRILHRIKKNKKLSQDVSVAYFKYDENNQPTVVNLDIDEGGNIQEGLPLEFFGGSLMETLEMTLSGDEDE